MESPASGANRWKCRQESGGAAQRRRSQSSDRSEGRGRKEEHLWNEVVSNIRVIAIPTNPEQDRKKKKTLEETMAAIFPNVVNLNIQDDLWPHMAGH